MATRDTSGIDWNEYFYYDETSLSCLRWRIDKLGGKGCVVKSAGDVAGSLCKTNNRWDVRLNNSLYKVHRVIWEMCNNTIELDKVIDHINGDATINLLSNLRLVTQGVNAKNIKMRTDNKSGIVGVSRGKRLSRGKYYYYWIATWKTDKVCNKAFPIAKLGETQAFKLACEYRKLMIQQLNEQGAGYTERHGEVV